MRNNDYMQTNRVRFILAKNDIHIHKIKGEKHKNAPFYFATN